ncbi:hypothetical protein PRNP1_015011 [Phytophthora ramorum]
MSPEQDGSARVVGTTSVFLRPLRYMFDVETDVTVESEEESAVLPFDSVHVHIRAATRPPLMERDQLLSGFLRAETQIHSNGGSNYQRMPSIDMDMYKLDKDSKEETDEDECGEGGRVLSSLRGTYVWLLVRLQPLAKGTAKPFSLTRPYAEDEKGALRVQYQISPSSESYCLPIDHTNVVKLVVTDELITQVDAKMLQFTFLFVPHVVPKSSEAKPAETKTAVAAITSVNYNDAALAASEATAAEEARCRQRAEAELAEAKLTAQAKDRERLDAQLQSKQDAQRAQELELARTEQAFARSLLERELATRDQQNQELKQTRKQLEDQLQVSNENAQRFQINVTSTDQALEMLKQRAASDAKEREELQRRLRVLEEEKLALQNKSRACTIQ